MAYKKYQCGCGAMPDPNGVDVPVKTSYAWYVRRHARWVPKYSTNRDGSRGEMYGFVYAHSELHKYRWWIAAKVWEAIYTVERWYQPRYRAYLEHQLHSRHNRSFAFVHDGDNTD